MKKYILIIPVFLVSLAVIAFYISRNIEITQSIRELTNIKQISYELELLTQQKTMLTKGLDVEINYDQIVKIDKQFQNQFLYYSKIIHKISDKKLSRLLDTMQRKNIRLMHIKEDIKTDNAVIKNSLLWLSKNYKVYLSKMDELNVNKEFLEYLFDVIYSKEDIIEVQIIDESIFQADLLNRHLQIIAQKQKVIKSLHQEFVKNDLTKDLDKVILHTLKSLNSLHKETKSIIEMLLLSSIFLILFGSFVYIREILTSLETQRLKNELQQFVDALNESAIVSKTDKMGLITYVNDKFCEISEYSRESLLGQSHNIIRHPDMDKSVFTQLWKTIENKKVFKATIKNHTKSGGFYYVDTSIMPILDIKGNIVEYLAVRYDVTELVHSRDIAIVAEKAKSEFLSNMSHELRTPLNAIVGFSSILSRSIKDEKQLKYLENIKESSDNLVGLINDILDLSKLQSGKFSLEYQEFDIQDKTKSLLGSFSTLVANAELEMQINLDNSSNIFLHADWLRISQIMTNLVSNAIKFSPKGKRIEFKMKYINNELILNVIDNGIGLSSEAQGKIFRPFEQADNSTTRVYGGTGLGLSIVLNLVEQMKGTINLKSTEGMGSNFEVTLPLQRVITQKNVQLQESEDEEAKEALCGHILIAEDNKTNQMLVGILMEEFGLTYTMANDGVEAVDKFGQEEFDLVLMDENMPNLNGCEAMKKIHSMYGHAVPIIALTANAMSGDRDRFLQEGMNDYVSKPIDDEELYNVIKKFLNK